MFERLLATLWFGLARRINIRVKLLFLKKKRKNNRISERLVKGLARVQTSIVRVGMVR